MVGPPGDTKWELGPARTHRLVGKVSMTKVAVVIPYYQREPGILRRAMFSIYAQELPKGVRVDVIVVDDELPAPPEPDIAGFAHDAMAVVVVKRPNGGPAAARNTGLETARGFDVVAFLDSDDSWMSRHLAVGLDALARGAELYFANDWYEDVPHFDFLRCRETLVADAHADDDGVLWTTGARLLPFMRDEYIVHPSTLIYDYRCHGAVRFDEDLAMAGEDSLFAITLASRAASIAFSSSLMVRRGQGVDLYRSAFDWNRPEAIRRMFYILILHKKILQRFCDTPASKERQKGEMDRLRRDIIRLLIRNARVHSRTNAWVIRQLVRKDAQFWLHLPRNAYAIVTTKLRGKHLNSPQADRTSRPRDK